MLNVFRRFIRSRFGAVFAMLFLAVIAFAFVAGDLSSGNGLSSLTGSGGTAAQAGGAKLSQADFQARVQRVFETERKSNPGMQISAFLAQNGAGQVYDQMVAALALKAFADDQGVHISKRLVDAQIAQIPAFQDAAGNFSPELFRQLLARERITEAALRDDITREILARQLLAPATLGARLADSMVLPYASLLLEARQGTIAAIPAMAFIDDKDPSDAQLADYYKRNADRFTISEQRRIRYAVIDAERFVQAATPSPADIAAYYNQNKARYAASQTRSIEQLVLPTQAAATAIADQVKGGKSLADAARSAGLSVSKLESQSRETLARASSRAVADAAFGAAQDRLAGPVRGPLGWVLLRVTDVQARPARTLDAVQAEIAATLRDQKQKALLSEFTGKLEDAVAEGGTFDEVVRDNGLKLETTAPVVATGQNVDDQAYKLPADVTPLLKPVFAMGADDDAQLVPITADKRYALVAPGDIIAAAPPPLAKVKAAILAQYKLNAGNAKAKALAEQIRAKVAKGENLAQAIAAAGVRLPAPQTVGGKRADVMRGDQRPPAEIAMLFSMAAGSVKTLPIGQDRGYFVIRLDGIKRGDAGNQPELLAQVRDQLGQVVGAEYGQGLERAIEKHLGVTRSASAVADVEKALAASNNAGQ
ncbi:SurA N-terminal domain-containing protein [Sphingobium sp. AN641]|uniref:SurA N-terminal domain-containing protein n=1 Tax=Sphingobium sp. AN641 TaxID=3133443 RepID=UPI0030C63956